MRPSRSFRVVALLAILVSACASRGPRLEALDADALYQLGVEHYENRRWRQASEVFERFTFAFPGHALQQDARFMLAESYFERREFLSAATEYIRLATDFPAGQRADIARFRACASFAELSPRVDRDQSYTVAAIDHCQSLIAFHPESEYIEPARAIVHELRSKLALKEFNAGETYLRLRAFDAAIMYFGYVLRDYPDTAIVPRALLRLYETYDRLGWDDERDDARRRLLRDFPESPEARGLISTAAAAGA